MVKFMGDINCWQLLLIRTSLQMAAMLPLMWWTRSYPLGPPDCYTRGKILAQGVLGGLLLLCIFVAVAHLPLGDSTAIFFSSPAWTMLLSCFILRDHCGLFRTLVAVILLTGVVVLTRPPFIFPPTDDPSSCDAGSNSSSHCHGVHHGGNITDPGEEDDGEEEGGFNVIGYGAALGATICSAWIVIITRWSKGLLKLFLNPFQD